MSIDVDCLQPLLLGFLSIRKSRLLALDSRNHFSGMPTRPKLQVPNTLPCSRRKSSIRNRNRNTRTHQCGFNMCLPQDIISKLVFCNGLEGRIQAYHPPPQHYAYKDSPSYHTAQSCPAHHSYQRAHLRPNSRSATMRRRYVE